MDSINPGTLKYPIQVYSLERTGDGRGGSNGSFEPFFSTLADIKPMKPITSTEGGKLTVVQPFSVLIRYAAERVLKPDMKVKWSGADYLIKNILPADPAKRKIQFMIVRAS